MTRESILISTILTDVAYVLEDYLAQPNYCFMVAVTLAETLQMFGIDAAVHSVRANAHSLTDNTDCSVNRLWDTSGSSYRLPKHVIIRIGEKFFDVTSRQMTNDCPWTMEVKVDGTPMPINGVEVRYWDYGEYEPSVTHYKKCRSQQLYLILRALFIAALRRNGFSLEEALADE